MSRMASAATLFKGIMLIQIVKSTSQGLVRLDSRNKTRLGGMEREKEYC